MGHTDLTDHTDFFKVPQRSASRRVTLATEGTQEMKEIKEMVGGDGRWTMEEGREIAVHG